MQSLEPLDFILFLGINQGVFLAITFQFIKNKNKSANNILSLLLLIAVIMLIGRMIFMRYITAELFRWTLLIDAVIFIFGPLCHIYFRRLATIEDKYFKLPWKHYVPFILQVSFAIGTMIVPLEIFVEKSKQGFFLPFYKLIEAAGILSNGYYWYLNTRLLIKYRKLEKENVSYKQGLLVFLRYFQISLGILIGLWSLSFLSLYIFKFSLEPLNYDWLWTGISSFIFIIGYYSLKEPELFRISMIKEKKHTDRLPQSEVFSIENRLDHLMALDKVFLQSNLTLSDLSEKLNTSTHKLSWYLNNVKGCSFYDYINKLRVKEFLRRIEQGEHIHHTILAIAMDSGFNSKSTFNKVFKMEMNDSPSDYIKKSQEVA